VDLPARALRLAQGWIAGSQHDVTALRASIATVRGAAPDPEAVQIVVRRSTPGTLEDLAGLRALGVTEVFFDLNLSPGADPDRVLEAFAPTRLRPSA
jgi:hypothetical protein